MFNLAHSSSHGWKDMVAGKEGIVVDQEAGQPRSAKEEDSEQEADSGYTALNVDKVAIALQSTF